MLTRIFVMVAIVVAIASCSPKRNDARCIETLEFGGRVLVSNDTLYYISDDAYTNVELKALESLFEDYVLILGTDF